MHAMNPDVGVTSLPYSCGESARSNRPVVTYSRPPEAYFFAARWWLCVPVTVNRDGGRVSAVPGCPRARDRGKGRAGLVWQRRANRSARRPVAVAWAVWGVGAWPHPVRDCPAPIVEVTACKF